MLKQAILFSLIGMSFIATCVGHCNVTCESNERCCGHVCVQGLSCVGVPCQTDSDCDRLFTLESCCDNKCYGSLRCPIRIGRSCSSDSDCFTGDICCISKCFNRKSCLGVACSSNSQCSKGQTCCGTCQDRSDCVGESCLFDKDCQEGEEKCCSRVCKKGDSCQANYLPAIIVPTIVFGIATIVIGICGYKYVLKRRAQILEEISRTQTNCSGTAFPPAAQIGPHFKPQHNQVPLEPPPSYITTPTTEFGGSYGTETAWYSRN